MNCPICKKELEIKSKKVGEDANGEAIYNEFAICHDCKKQWNLDKQRAKNAAPAAQPQKEAKEEKKPSAKASVKAPSTEASREAPKTPDGEAAPRRKKKRPAAPAVENAASAVKAVDGAASAASSAKVSTTAAVPTSAAASSADSASAERPRPKKKKRPVNPDGTLVTRTPKTEGTDAAAKTGKAQKTTDTAAKAGNAPKATDTAAKAGNAPKAVADGEAPRPRKKKRPVNPDGTPVTHAPKKRPAADSPANARPAKVKPAPRAMDEPIEEFSDAKEQSYSNIPPKHVREAREKEMRDNYQNMLDEGTDEEEKRFPTALVVILVLLIIAAAAFAGYWFLLRDIFPLF